MSGKQSAAMDKAQALVEQKGKTPPQAALMAGVAVQSIYRTAWYKAHRAAAKTVAKQ
jgi:hypothetical protein